MDAALIDVWFRQIAGQLAAPRESCGGLARMMLDRYGDIPDARRAVRALREAVFWCEQAKLSHEELASREPEPEVDPLAEIRATVAALSPEEREALGLQEPRDAPRSAGQVKEQIRAMIAGLSEADQEEIMGESALPAAPGPVVDESAVVAYVANLDEAAFERVRGRINEAIGAEPAEPASPPVWVSECGRAIVREREGEYHVSGEVGTCGPYTSLKGAQSAIRPKLRAMDRRASEIS